MATQPDRDPLDIVPPNPAPAATPEQVDKPRWSRPEIVSFKPVEDAQGVAYRIGDGVSNLS